jgi:hypothetical protein
LAFSQAPVSRILRDYAGNQQTIVFLQTRGSHGLAHHDGPMPGGRPHRLLRRLLGSETCPRSQVETFTQNKIRVRMVSCPKLM